jgi:threonine dehydratase
VEVFITIEDRHAEQAMRRLARPEGVDPPIVAGESGAAGVGGLLALLEEPGLAPAKDFLGIGAGASVLVLNTEGATDPEGYAGIVDGKR